MYLTSSNSCKKYSLAMAVTITILTVHLFVVLPCMLPSRWFFVHRCRGIDHPWTSDKSKSVATNVRLALLTVADQFLEYDASLHLRARLYRNRQSFCDRWNFTCMFVDTRSMPSQQYPVAWSKLDLAELALTDHDFVLVVDADAVIMRLDIDLGMLLIDMMEHDHSLAISSDINNLNSGVFVMRRGSWSKAFFAEVQKIRPALSRQTITLPLKYENRAFFYLTGMWPTDCFGISRADTWLAPTYNDTAYFREGVHNVDRCLFNTRPYNPSRLWDFAKSDASYDDTTNAFIVHAAGGLLRDKLRILHILLKKTDNL